MRETDDTSDLLDDVADNITPAIEAGAEFVRLRARAVKLYRDLGRLMTDYHSAAQVGADVVNQTAADRVVTALSDVREAYEAVLTRSYAAYNAQFKVAAGAMLDAANSSEGRLRAVLERQFAQHNDLNAKVGSDGEGGGNAN